MDYLKKHEWLSAECPTPMHNRGRGQVKITNGYIWGPERGLSGDYKTIFDFILFSDIKSRCCGRNPTGGGAGGVVKERFFDEAPFFWQKRRRALAGKVGDNGAHGADASPYSTRY